MSRSRGIPKTLFLQFLTHCRRSLPQCSQHPEVGYEAIFQADSETIRTLLKKPKNLRSDKLGFFGVLHTWGHDLAAYHPHVHFVVPGGGVSPDGSKWLQVKPDHLFHPLPAKGLYRKLFVEAIRKNVIERRRARLARITWHWIRNSGSTEHQRPPISENNDPQTRSSSGVRSTRTAKRHGTALARGSATKQISKRPGSSTGLLEQKI
ncbi:MAG: transposase [Planctomycetota bacterium]